MSYSPFLVRTAAASLLGVALLCCAVLFAFDKKQQPADPALDNLKVPEGFTIERAVPENMVSHPFFATLDSQGRLFVIESSGKTTSTEEVLEHPDFQIRLLEDLNHDGRYDKMIVFADKIPYPMGGTFYQGSFYVAAPPHLMRFTDTDGDGVADKREQLLTGWTLNHNAATLSGPFIGPDGWLYMCDARRGFDITTKEGQRLQGKGARIWRCRPDGSGLESLAGGGFDNTIELVFMPSGETIGTMTYFTDPRNGFRDALMHWVEGGVYPKPYRVIEDDRLKLTGPLMPVMTKLPRVSHAGLMRYRGTALGPDFQGNLFSAQFNTGRIMRHVITPEGATYRTTQEPFMTSDNLDSHPTDVLEDADGSLLVVNTGGWFIAGCPLSVVAKANVHGGIFRIRKRQAPQVVDPWGRQLHFPAMSPLELSAYLADPRPAVRDQATEQLVLRGQAAVEPLNKLRLTALSEEVRAAAVFALYRINTPQATSGVLTALNDKSPVVRTAAARVLGMAREPRALNPLMQLVQHDKAPVRRQAATALGQIGDARAVSALLAAAAKPNDRFVEHAIVYSLISLGQTAALVKALQHPALKVRKAALIALDQIDNSPLQKKQLVPFLASKNAELQQTGIWVAGHHPDWTSVAIDFLKARLAAPTLTEAQQASLTALMQSFSGDLQLQQFVSTQLEAATTPVARKLLLLEAISRSAPGVMPQTWEQLLGKLLQANDTRIRTAVLELIASRRLPALEEQLSRIIQDPKAPPAFQLKALEARLPSRPQLSEAEFALLLRYSGPRQELPIRQAAVRLQAQADLSETQLLAVAREQLPRADLFLLPGLVNAFEGSSSEAVGQALVQALQSASDRLDNLSLPQLQKVLQAYPAAVQATARPLLERLGERQAGQLKELQALEVSLLAGDVGEGRKLFFGKVNCSSCHAVVGQGGNFGPDLTNIGEIRSRQDMLEAILFPSASFAREYETSRILTKTATYTGIIKEQLAREIVVETGPGLRLRVSRADITAIEPQNVSMMPPGLHKQLSTREMADLMAYLTSLPDGLGQLKHGNLKSATPVRH